MINYKIKSFEIPSLLGPFWILEDLVKRKSQVSLKKSKYPKIS